MRAKMFGIVALAAGTAGAGTIGFETSTVTGNSGGYTSLSIADGDGVTATITRLGTITNRFDIASFGLNPRPASWGNRTLSPFFSIGSAISDVFQVNFVAPGRTITGVGIQYGDYGADSGNVRFQAFSATNGAGTLLSNQTQLWNGNFGLGSPAGVFSAAGSILSIRFWGEQGSFNNSLYWDNLQITSVPENVIPLPQAGGMAMAGLGLLAVRRRRAALA